VSLQPYRRGDFQRRAGAPGGAPGTGAALGGVPGVGAALGDGPGLGSVAGVVLGAGPGAGDGSNLQKAGSIRETPHTEVAYSSTY